MKLVPGTVVDRYRVEAELGRGGMARVYLVRHTTLDTQHALKVLTLSGEELRERLVREGRVQAKLDHPNIVPVRDILVLQQGPGLLMDFIDGLSLDAWLREHDPDDAVRERIFTAIVQGVGFAHDEGVVHRDLKPGNVMMQLRHGEWVPRVADFGLAKLVSPDEGDGVLQSRTGRPMGTPAYMAPEQVRSAKHVDARADVFALGCILYELYCGQRAFLGSDSLEVFNRITQGSYRPPREAAADLEPRIEQAIFGALAVHVDDRIPDCATLLAVLRGERSWAVRADSQDTFFGDFGDPGPASMPAGPQGVAPTLTPEVQEPELPSSGSLAPVDGSLAPPPPSPATAASGGTPRWWIALVVGGAVLVAVALLGAAGDRVLRPSPATIIPPAPVVAPVTPAVVEPVAPALVEPEPVEVTPVAQPPAVAVPVVEPPRPAPRAKPVPARSALPVGTGRVEVSGDAVTVRFRGSNRQVSEAGALEPGAYVIEAAFDDGPAMHAGNLELRAGETVRLRCSSDTLMCSP